LIHNSSYPPEERPLFCFGRLVFPPAKTMHKVPPPLSSSSTGETFLYTLPTDFLIASFFVAIFFFFFFPPPWIHGVTAGSRGAAPLCKQTLKCGPPPPKTFCLHPILPFLRCTTCTPPFFVPYYSKFFMFRPILCCPPGPHATPQLSYSLITNFTCPKHLPFICYSRCVSALNHITPCPQNAPVLLSLLFCPTQPPLVFPYRATLSHRT